MRDDSNHVIIVGDLFPSKNNECLFLRKENELVDENLLSIIQDSRYAFCNLEGTLTSCNDAIIKLGPNIKAHPDCLRAYHSMGFTHLATANNHINDFGQQGYLDTLHAIEQNKFPFIGSGINSSSIEHYIMLEVGGKKVVFYNVAETMFNTPTLTSAGVYLYDEYVVCNELKAIKTSGVADFIVVIYHGGIEYFPYPSPELKKRFHRMADCGADVVLAQHTHCIGCEEYYDGAYLLYGQGNFLFDRQSQPITKSGIVLRLSFSEKIEIEKFYTVVDDGRVSLNSCQSFEDFDERCRHIQDDDYLVEKLKAFVVTQRPVKTKQFERKHWYDRIVLKILPMKYRQAYYKKMQSAKFTKSQKMRILYTLLSEQQHETAFYMVINELENELQNQK